MSKGLSLDIPTLEALFESEPANLFRALDEVKRRLEDYPDPSVWISRVSWERISARASALVDAARKGGEGARRHPLFGIPFAVKDNIDVEGMETTAACPAFAYKAAASASAVARLEAAGAILIGKTNMDQFATGLVGTRSPYGTVRNPFHAGYIAGGSSSGSAVAVAAGLVSFALGTDTAGSGRVPAGFNNVVGLKPTRGAVSAHGVFPACKSLDCVSVFALTCGDAFKVFDTCRGTDSRDAFSRAAPWYRHRDSAAFAPGKKTRFHFGVPDARHLEFFGDHGSRDLFRQAVDRMEKLGGISMEIPFAPFAEAARLLYQGPWLAERHAAFGEFLDGNPGEVLPVIREVMGKAKSPTAVEGFRAYYRLRELRAQAEGLFKGMDFLLTPTAPTQYKLEEVEADPLALNTRLGYYTNFVNLMDLCALAVPSGRKENGLPFGVTLIAPAFQEGLLASLAADFHAETGLSMGTTEVAVPKAVAVAGESGTSGAGGASGDPPPEASRQRTLTRLAVAGLHLSGQSLNPQLLDLGARLLGTFKTVPRYRLYALERRGRKFPGMVRQSEGGAAVLLEVWELTPAALGAFLENVKEPLCIGTVELDNGEKVKGFLCEPSGVEDAVEITAYGGWRAYLAETKPPG
ncbi:MAG TPA: allophanate hydrolase [Fibrobacteria bacterium]|nr:allophanate hydrolase [Fibrobacteria bacterium]